MKLFPRNRPSLSGPVIDDRGGALARMPRVASWLVVGACLGALAGCGGTSDSDRMAVARSAFQKHDYQRAEVQLKTLLQSKNDDAEAWLLLGRTSVAQRRFDDAVHQLERARQGGVAKAKWQLPLAQALISSGQYDQALETLKTIDPDTTQDQHATALALRGMALSETDKPDAAEKAFGAALSIEPKLELALRGRATLAEQRGDFDAARRDLKNAIDAAPNNRRALAMLGQLEYGQQRCDVAEDPLSKALAPGQGSLPDGRARQVRNILADCQIRTNQMDAAQKNVSTVLAADANDPYGNYLQALIDISNQNLQQAANHVQATLNADPDNLRSMTLMAWVRIAQGQSDTARPYLDRVLARAPDNVTALRMQAGLMMQNNQRQKALDMVREAYQRNPDAPGLRESLAAVMAWLDTHGNDKNASTSSTSGDGSSDVALQIDLARSLAGLGSTSAALTVLDQVDAKDLDQRRQLVQAKTRVLLAAGDQDKAVAAARSLASADNSIDSQLLLADIYASTDQFDKAAAVIEPLAKKNPDDARIARARATLASHRGDYAAALSALQPLQKKNPDDAALARQIASLQARDGQIDQAVQQLQAFTQAHPDDETSAMALARLYLADRNFDKASALIDQHANGQRDATAWQMMKGQVQIANNQSQQGLATLAEAARKADSPEASLILARAQLSQNQSDAAADTLRKIRRSQPDYWQAASLLALVEARRGNTQAAMDQVADVRHAGQSFSADLLTGDIQRAARHYPAADAAYQKAYAARPSATIAVARFDNRVAGQLADPAAPLADWNQKSPGDASVALRLGEWYQAHDQAQQAAQVYRELLKSAPQNVVALNNLALLVADQNSTQSLAYAKKAHQAAPNNPAIADTYGWLLWQAGQKSTARELLKSAYQKAGDRSAEIAYHYGVAFAGQGGNSEQALKQALKGQLDEADKTHARELLSGKSDSGSAS